MRTRVCTSAVAVVLFLVLAAAGQGTASAQFSFAELPDNDFTWRWGDQRGRRIEDFSIRAHDQGFNCVLTGELRPGSRLSRMDMRRMESDLRSSMSFVATATNRMNGLERQRDLGWAVLDCVKPDPEENEEE